MRALPAGHISISRIVYYGLLRRSGLAAAHAHDSCRRQRLSCRGYFGPSGRCISSFRPSAEARFFAALLHAGHYRPLLHIDILPFAPSRLHDVLLGT